MGSVSYDFSGETTIATGGSSGIGREIAVRFGDAGSHVIVADVQQVPKDIDTERPIHDRIRRKGGSAEFLQCDVSKPESHCQLIGRANDLGGVDVYINNAATYMQGPLEDVTP